MVMLMESYHLLLGSQEQGQLREKEIKAEIQPVRIWTLKLPNLDFKAAEELLCKIMAVLMY